MTRVYGFPPEPVYVPVFEGFLYRAVIRPHENGYREEPISRIFVGAAADGGVKVAWRQVFRAINERRTVLVFARCRDDLDYILRRSWFFSWNRACGVFGPL
jgi:hypothetical protein